AADDALVSVLARLDDFRGASRFTTWAYKFAILEASVSLRRRAWKGRELPLDGDSWQHVALSVCGPHEKVEQLELLNELKVAVEELLTERQRQVFVAVAVTGVPMEVVAGRLAALRGARRRRQGLAGRPAEPACGARTVRRPGHLCGAGRRELLVEAGELAVEATLERSVEGVRTRLWRPDRRLCPRPAPRDDPDDSGRAEEPRDGKQPGEKPEAVQTRGGEDALAEPRDDL